MMNYYSWRVILKLIYRVAQAGRKSEKRIKFGSWDVYYFGRDQGFEVVPKQGEVALGFFSYARIH